jgi:hypothetical protein
MAHFAKIDENNIVQDVLVFDIPDDQLPEMELPTGWRWLRTSYNNNIRKNYAGIGYTYDAVRDAFIAPKPFPSFVLNEETCKWEAPLPYPEGAMEAGIIHSWDEETNSWIRDDRSGV